MRDEIQMDRRECFQNTTSIIAINEHEYCHYVVSMQFNQQCTFNVWVHSGQTQAVEHNQVDNPSKREPQPGKNDTSLHIMTRKINPRQLQQSALFVLDGENLPW